MAEYLAPDLRKNLQRGRLRLPSISWQCAILVMVTPLSATAGEDTPAAGAQRARLAITESKRVDPVDFEKEILPILKSSCLACHNQTKAKADLVLETPQTILKGGESGPAVVPRKSAESLLLKAASHQEKPFMPPKDNKVNAADLTPEQLGLVKLWIDQGAQGEVRGAAPVEWQPLPEGVNPIYAVVLTPDGQFAACSRANQIFVYHIPSGQLVQNLTDPGLSPESDKSSSPPPALNKGVAHRDLVHSLAFSPDGNLLASGGYREVKLWRRPRNVEKLRIPFPSTNAMQALAVSADRKWAAATFTDGSVKLWDAASGQEKKLIIEASAEEGRESPKARQMTAHLQFSPDGARLCMTSDHVLQVWTIPDGHKVAATNLPAEITAMTWLPLGSPSPEPTPQSKSSEPAIATGDADGNIRLWQTASAGDVPFQQLKDFEGAKEAVRCLEASAPQGSNAPILLAAGTSGGLVRVWDVAKAKIVLEVNHGAPVESVALRGDGRRLASAGSNQNVKLWNVEDGKLVAEMKGDRYAQEALGQAERNLIVASNEVAYRKSVSEGAEKEQKSASDRVGKANEAFAAAEKAFGEKQDKLKGATESSATAEKALADLKAELKKASDDYQAAELTAKQAATEAKSALERATQAKLIADQAAQTKLETERIATDSAAVAARSLAAAGTSLAGSIKTAAERMAADAATVAEKAKAFAESIAEDATAKSKLASEAKTVAEKAIDEVAAKSFALGQIKPRFDKVTSENPDKIKQAGDKFNTASNAVAAAEKEFKKTEQTKSVADHELQLARTAAEQATNSVQRAKAGLQSAETDRAKTGSSVEEARKVAAGSEQPVRALAFSRDNLILATTGDDHKTHTWSAETGAPFETLSPSDASMPRKDASNEVFALAFTGPKTLLCANAQGLTIWDLNPGWVLERTLGKDSPDSPLADRVNAVRFSPDGKLLATGGGEPSRSGEIVLWNVADGSMRKEIRDAHSDTVLALDFSPDGKYLASGAADKFAKVIDLASGKVVKSFEGHLHHVLGVSWKRDGRTLASSGADNVVKMWDFTTGERKKNIEGFNKEVTSIAFLDATDQALASSGDNQVRLVRENGESVRAFSGATDYVYSAVATPDGKIVAAGGQDGMLRVWNGADGKSITTFPAPDSK